MKRGCPTWFGLLHPHSLLDTKVVLAALRDSIKVPNSDPLYWELICSELSNVLEKSGTPPERNINHKIDLMPNSVTPAKRWCRTSPVELTDIRKQLDKYLRKGWIRPSTSAYGAPIFIFGKRWNSNDVHRL